MESDNEVDILRLDIGGVTLKEASAITFLQWVAKKLNNVATYSATVTELRMLVSNPPMTRLMSEDQKIGIIRKLRSVGVVV